MTTTTAPQYALCYCTDGQHADGDHDKWRTDRAHVEADLRLLSASDWVVVHEVSRVVQVTEVPFVDVEAADYREAMTDTAARVQEQRAAQRMRDLTAWADTAFQLPDDVKGAA